MSIYVDPEKLIKGQYWCHMSADSLAELHAFAEQIGVKKCWFHNPKRRGMPHYDLGTDARKRAVAAGAVEITAREMVDKFRGQTSLDL